VAEALEHLTLAEEAPDDLCIGGGLGPQEFHGQLALGPKDILGPVHEGHPAFPEPLQDPHGADLFRDQQAHGASSNSTRFRPAALAWYSATSARASREPPFASRSES